MSCDNCPFRKGVPCMADVSMCERHADMELHEELREEVEYWKQKYNELK